MYLKPCCIVGHMSSFKVGDSLRRRAYTELIREDVLCRKVAVDLYAQLQTVGGAQIDYLPEGKCRNLVQGACRPVRMASLPIGSCYEPHLTFCQPKTRPMEHAACRPAPYVSQCVEKMHFNPSSLCGDLEVSYVDILFPLCRGVPIRLNVPSPHDTRA